MTVIMWLRKPVLADSYVGKVYISHPPEAFHISEKTRESIQTEPCSFCSDIDGRKFSPTIAPVCMEGECCSLSQQCLRQIAKTQSLLHPDHLRNLPLPLLEELKFYLTDAPLFTLSDLFRENGIDTRPAWEVLLYKRFGYKYLILCEDWIAPWYRKPMFQVGKQSPDPCQVYMTKLCQTLIESAMDTHIQKRRGIKEKICDSCLTRFSAYVSSLKYLKVSWKQLSWITDADTRVSEILKSTLKCIVDWYLCNIPDNVHADIDDINFVKQLLAGNKLKSLSLGALYPRRDYHRLLMSLFSDDETKEKVKQPVTMGETSDESDEDKSVKAESKGESGGREIDLFDEALQSNMLADGNQATASLAALSEIRERIQALEQNQGDFNEEKGCLESLSVQMMDFSVDFIQLLQACTTIKCLEYRCKSQDEQVWSEVCAMVGSRRLTRLGVKAESPIFFLLMATLFENYRSDDGISQPMEFLSFYEIKVDPNYGAGLLDYHYPIQALRQLELIDSQLSASMVANLMLFLQYNTALTHLHINDVIMETLPTIATILAAVSKHRTLECLTLVLDIFHRYDTSVVQMRTEADEEALVSLLKTNPQLKHLVLKRCNVSRQFVSSEAFLSAVKSHRGLEHLSLGNNKLGTAGVDLLLALSESQAAPSLKALGLDKCEIPGKQLLAAARVISERHSGRLFLHHLSLCHNLTNLSQLLELQTCFSSCVRLPHIEGHTAGRRGTSDLAGFYEEEVDDSDSHSD